MLLLVLLELTAGREHDDGDARDTDRRALSAQAAEIERGALMEF